MFRFNYPMPAETKMRNAKRHNLYWAASHLYYTMLKLLAIAATSSNTNTRAASSLHAWIPRTDPLISSNTCSNITVKISSCHTTKIIMLPPFCPCPTAQREGSGSLQWPNKPQQWYVWEDRGSLLVSHLLVFVTIRTQKTYCGGNTKVQHDSKSYTRKAFSRE